MSQTIVSINNLFNKNIKRNTLNLSTQDLYSLYFFIKKSNTDLTFSKFYLLVVVFFNHLTQPRVDTNFKVILSFLYLRRTTDIFSIILIDNVLLKSNSNFTFPNKNVDFSRLNNF